jgi:hypothetical protein
MRAEGHFELKLLGTGVPRPAWLRSGLRLQAETLAADCAQRHGPYTAAACG